MKGGKGVVRARKRFALFISNEDVNDIIETIKWFEDSDALIDGVTEIVKHKIKKQESRFIGAF